MVYSTGFFMLQLKGNKMTMMTCMTLSAEPFKFNTPRSIVFQNYVSKFDDCAGLHKSKLDAIFKIKTPYFFFQDYDDPLPNNYPVPEKSIVYGDFFTRYVASGHIKRTVAEPWSESWHLKNPLMVHKAICNTAAARAVASLLPQGEFLTEPLLYFFMCKAYGFTYDPSLEFIWNKSPKGLHTKAEKSISNAVAWIKQNQDAVLSKLLR